MVKNKNTNFKNVYNNNKKTIQAQVQFFMFQIQKLKELKKTTENKINTIILSPPNRFPTD